VGLEGRGTGVLMRALPEDCLQVHEGLWGEYLEGWWTHFLAARYWQYWRVLELGQHQIEE
jgi:hypothetical protein